MLLVSVMGRRVQVLQLALVHQELLLLAVTAAAHLDWAAVLHVPKPPVVLQVHFELHAAYRGSCCDCLLSGVQHTCGSTPPQWRKTMTLLTTEEHQAGRTPAWTAP